MIQPVSLSSVSLGTIAEKLNEVIKALNEVTEITDLGVVHSAQHEGVNRELRVHRTVPRSERP